MQNEFLSYLHSCEDKPDLYNIIFLPLCLCNTKTCLEMHQTLKTDSRICVGNNLHFLNKFCLDDRKRGRQISKACIAFRCSAARVDKEIKLVKPRYSIVNPIERKTLK